VGHVCPEAAAGGPIAVVRDGDLIRIDLETGVIELIETVTGRTGAEAVAREIAERQALLDPWRGPVRSGLMGLYTSLAGPADEGARMLSPKPAGATG
jgi:dihydroxyacid dehydratase/phosphogluconate dehydratase